MRALRDREEITGSAVTAMDERGYLPALLAALALANVSAYGRDATIAATFGANGRTDAYFVAAFLPTLLTTVLVLESAVPALLPALSQTASDAGATWRLLRRVLEAGFVALAGAAIVTWAGAAPLVTLLAHGWQAQEVRLAASLLRVMAWSLLPLGLSAVLAAVLNVHHRYTAPPLSMGIMNVAVIVSTLMFGGWLGIYAPAWGVLAGSALSLLLQMWSVTRLRLRSAPALVPVPFVTVGRAMLPTLLFSVLAQNVVVVERWLASTLPAGRISYLVYAGKLMMSPLLVITAAGGLLAFVAMSHANASRDQEAFRVSFVRSARLLIILLSLATLVLVILRRPIVELALEHGRFTAHDTDMTATLLAIYALGLLPNGLAWLLYRSLQSRGRYWDAVRVAMIATAVYVASILLLFHLWGLRGIAAAFPVSQIASCFLLYRRSPAYLRLSAAHALPFARSIMLLSGGTGCLLVALQIGVATVHLDTTSRAVIELILTAAMIPCALAFGLQLLRVPEGTLFRSWLGQAVDGVLTVFGR